MAVKIDELGVQCFIKPGDKGAFKVTQMDVKPAIVLWDKAQSGDFPDEEKMVAKVQAMMDDIEMQEEEEEEEDENED